MHIMFDIDGTLIDSNGFDADCFVAAVQEAKNIHIDTDWSRYQYVSDRGILKQVIDEHNLSETLEELEAQVKPIFIQKVSDYLSKHPAKPIDGAVRFLKNIKNDSRYTMSIATGGWGETAILKLKSAGFDLNGIQLFSSNDHYDRCEIMKKAANQCAEPQQKVLYFGDAEWDVKACEALDWTLIIVGPKTNHENKVKCFKLSTLDKILDYS